MAILEAMAYGLPTVAYDCAPGVRDSSPTATTGSPSRRGTPRSSPGPWTG